MNRLLCLSLLYVVLASDGITLCFYGGSYGGQDCPTYPIQPWSNEPGTTGTVPSAPTWSLSISQLTVQYTSDPDTGNITIWQKCEISDGYYCESAPEHYVTVYFPPSFDLSIVRADTFTPVYFWSWCLPMFSQARAWFVSLPSNNAEPCPMPNQNPILLS